MEKKPAGNGFFGFYQQEKEESHGNILVIEPRTYENIMVFDGDIMVFMGIEW